MDRYLEAKKVESRRRRLEVARLRASLKQLQARLSRWVELHYWNMLKLAYDVSSTPNTCPQPVDFWGVSSDFPFPGSYTHYQRKPVSITEVLGLTLQFVHSEGKDPAPSIEKDPAPSSEKDPAPRTDSTSSEGPSSPAPCNLAGQDPCAVDEDVLDSDHEGSRGKRPRTSLHPTPQFVSRLEIKTLDACLSRWTHEVEQDIAGQGRGGARQVGVGLTGRGGPVGVGVGWAASLLFVVLLGCSCFLRAERMCGSHTAVSGCCVQRCSDVQHLLPAPRCVGAPGPGLWRPLLGLRQEESSAGRDCSKAAPEEQRRQLSHYGGGGVPVWG